MKILVIAEKEKTTEIIKKHLPPLGFDFIFYSNPVKALDNISEIEPELVIFSAEDYPRHWKIFLKVLRNFYTHEESVFILLKTSFFSEEDAGKAAFLGVNGLIDEDLEEYMFIDRLKAIFSRYLLPRESRRYRRYFVSPSDKIDFIFNHPETMEIASGKVVEISPRGTTILIPEKLSSALIKGSKINYCSIKIDERIITTDCTVYRSEFYTTLLFDDITDDDIAFLKNYFEERALRELKKNA
ncbi:MAG: hypothetical protein RBT69_05125 [Spirochaetia bacterium]|jgi:hypothetical protein|nr:hypothetical protein [Spirochaetia bacterium]